MLVLDSPKLEQASGLSGFALWLSTTFTTDYQPEKGNFPKKGPDLDPLFIKIMERDLMLVFLSGN